MKVELFSFQEQAVKDIIQKTKGARAAYNVTRTPQVISFTAPTGAGKTVIMTSVIEGIIYGNDSNCEEQSDAIIVWLSDSPALNEQSRSKMLSMSDKIKINTCITIKEDNFDRETLEDGKVYFLNTQKITKAANLTKYSDSRQYTIWDTLRNTVEEKSDRLYFIIDEAHRGMQGSEAGKATSIMQKFLKGDNSVDLPSMPIVIGMSATIARFNRLVENMETPSIHHVDVKTETVRRSGLLKDWIVLAHPSDTQGNNDYAVLECAAEEWNRKCVHWDQYCKLQGHKQVRPVFVIQVANAAENTISATDIGECITRIENKLGIKFNDHEVVHTFGDMSTISVSGLNVEKVAPESIAEDRTIKLVFFKENLSTGWDCPRAETMMSFRSAQDATYIAQLLGRMIRTPLQRHIDFDDSLNDVYLFLPHYDSATVDKIIEELQNAEGGDIPVYVEDEPIGGGTTSVLTCRPRRPANRPIPQIPGQGSLFDFPTQDDETETQNANEDNQQTAAPSNVAEETQVQEIPNTTENTQENSGASNATRPTTITTQTSSQGYGGEQTPIPATTSVREGNQQYGEQTTQAISGTEVETNGSNQPTQQNPIPQQPQYVQPNIFVKEIDRDKVVDAINSAELLTFEVRTATTIDNYLIALLKLCRILSRNNIYKAAEKDVKKDIVDMVATYINELKSNNLYEEAVKKVLEYSLTEKKFDVFGKRIEETDMFTTSDADLDRKVRNADREIGNFGLSNEYGRYYYDDDNPNAYKIETIIFSQEATQITKLSGYAKTKFEALVNQYRRPIQTRCSDADKQAYKNIVAGVDLVSEHLWEIPKDAKFKTDPEGKKYYDHLFVDETKNPPYAQLKLNSWEEAVLAEEQKREDFVTWIRNPAEARNKWALVIPYQKEGTYHGAHPDMVIVREDEDGYIFDILEPHNPEFKDNLGKSIAFAKYVARSTGVAALGRVQLIREATDNIGRKGFKRLDFSKIEIREKVQQIINTDQLDAIFEADGIFESFNL